jgi:hypothetical protein
MNGFHLTCAREPAAFESSQFGYRSMAAAVSAAPIVNLMRAMKYSKPEYTHVVHYVHGHIVKLVELPRLSS